MDNKSNFQSESKAINDFNISLKDEYYMYNKSNFQSEIKAINDFNLPSKDECYKLKIEQFVGFISRKSHVFLLFKETNALELIDYEKANEKFMLWIASIFGKNSKMYSELYIYKNKIENLPDNIIKLGRKLNSDYYYLSFNINQEIYKTHSQLNLIKLEQLFIQSEFPSCYLEEFTKPNMSQDISNWIYYITYDTSSEKRLEKMNLLKEYLDEYLQYLFDKPRNIWSINNLTLPLSNIERKQIQSIDQYAGYFSRSSIVVISSINKTHLISHELANKDVMKWIKSIFGKDSDEVKILEIYQSNIECISENVKILGKQLIEDYDNANNQTEIKQCLIDLEQYLFRYNKEPEFVNEVYYNDLKNRKKFKNSYNNGPVEWISKITNSQRKKVIILVQYLDEYFYHVLNRKRNIESYNDNNNHKKKIIYRF